MRCDQCAWWAERKPNPNAEERGGAIELPPMPKWGDCCAINVDDRMIHVQAKVLSLIYVRTREDFGCALFKADGDA